MIIQNATLNLEGLQHGEQDDIRPLSTSKIVRSVSIFGANIFNTVQHADGARFGACRGCEAVACAVWASGLYFRVHENGNTN